jgi:hypothetical protein
LLGVTDVTVCGPAYSHGRKRFRRDGRGCPIGAVWPRWCFAGAPLALPIASGVLALQFAVVPPRMGENAFDTVAVLSVISPSARLRMLTGRYWHYAIFTQVAIGTSSPLSQLRRSLVFGGSAFDDRHLGFDPVVRVRFPQLPLHGRCRCSIAPRAVCVDFRSARRCPADIGTRKRNILLLAMLSTRSSVRCLPSSRAVERLG